MLKIQIQQISVGHKWHNPCTASLCAHPPHMRAMRGTKHALAGLVVLLAAASFNPHPAAAASVNREHVYHHHAQTVLGNRKDIQRDGPPSGVDNTTGVVRNASAITQRIPLKLTRFVAPNRGALRGKVSLHTVPRSPSHVPLLLPNLEFCRLRQNVPHQYEHWVPSLDLGMAQTLLISNAIVCMLRCPLLAYDLRLVLDLWNV